VIDQNGQRVAVYRDARGHLTKRSAVCTHMAAPSTGTRPNARGIAHATARASSLTAPSSPDPPRARSPRSTNSCCMLPGGERHRLSARRRQHAARQRFGHRGSERNISSNNFGEERARRIGSCSKHLRAELGTPTTSARCSGTASRTRRDTGLLEASLFLLHYPFANRVHPGALDAINALERRGRVAILSDGDVVFQPRKIERSGIWGAVEGNVPDLHPQGADAGRRRAAAIPRGTT